jgi:hypothetical protein
MIYKIADGCGGLLPAADGEYYTKLSSSCRGNGTTQSEPCTQMARIQPYAKQLSRVKIKATKAQSVAKQLSTQVQSAKH